METKALSVWVINGLVDFTLLFFFLECTLCPFIPPFREMAGVPLALTNDATELIFALPCSVPLDSRPSALHARTTKTPN